MIVQTLDFWITAVSQVWSWFVQLLTASGMTGLYLMMFAATVAFRLLAVPILGQSFKAGSDTAGRKPRKE